MPYHSPELVDVVQELARQIAELQAVVRQLRGHASAAQAELVGAAHAALGDRVFSAAELLGRALRADGPGLRLAALLAGRSVRSTGRLLAAAAGKVTLEGLSLRSAGSARAGVVWLIDTSPDRLGICMFETRKPADSVDTRARRA